MEFVKLIDFALKKNIIWIDTFSYEENEGVSLTNKEIWIIDCIVVQRMTQSEQMYWPELPSSVTLWTTVIPPLEAAHWDVCLSLSRTTTTTKKNRTSGQQQHCEFYSFFYHIGCWDTCSTFLPCLRNDCGKGGGRQSLSRGPQNRRTSTDCNQTAI